MNGNRGHSPILAAALLLVVGTLGVLIGVVLDRTLLTHRADRAWEPHMGLHGPPDREIRRHIHARILAHMADELDLTESQREQVGIVLERQGERLAVVMAEARPQIGQILEETHRQLREILTPEQREKLDEKWRARGRGHSLLWPNPVHGPDSVQGT